MQPAFFSILERHIGQKDTLPLFSSAHPSSCFVIASSQVTSFPCHVSRQLKQTTVEHFGHFNFSTLSFSARMNDSQFGLVHQRTNGSDSIDFLSLNLSYFSSSSFWPWSVKIYASLALSTSGLVHSESKHLILSTSARSICSLSIYMVHSLQNLCLQSNSTVNLSLAVRGLASGTISFV